MCGNVVEDTAQTDMIERMCIGVMSADDPPSQYFEESRRKPLQRLLRRTAAGRGLGARSEIIERPICSMTSR